VQLGTFEDILSEQTNLRTLVVGFTLEIPKGSARTKIWRGTTLSEIKSVKITPQFRSASSNGTSVSAIEASKVSVESIELEVAIPQYYRSLSSPKDANEAQRDFSMTIKRLSSVELDEFLTGVSSQYLRFTPYGLNESNYAGVFSAKGKLADKEVLEPSLITFSHFLPTRLVRKYRIGARRKLQVAQILNSLIWDPHSNASFNKLSEFLKPSTIFLDDAKEDIIKFCQNKGISNIFSGRSLNDLLQWLRSLEVDEEQNPYFFEDFEEIITPGILEQLPPLEQDAEALEIVANNFYTDSLMQAVEQTTQFFTSKIRYLGPLRADPQASQKFAPTSELDDVGAKGEYAATVYHANQNAIIQWYNPSTEITEKSTLNAALNTWVRYLGVANEIKTQEAGLSGVNWQVVHIEGHKALPLSAVGVGVSQVLPILVMGLLAPDNTLLIVEQPELHLHPTVQARLGDFFMGLAKCNKQCLIETHSENLVSQLRLHIVEAGGQENADCLIYFADQDEQGAARFDPIEISLKGNILNWPDGFFDETMLQEDRITAAGLKKRAKKANDG
jgi:predicted ATPase